MAGDTTIGSLTTPLLRRDQELTQGLARLASGNRLQRAADDPAAMVTSNLLASQARGLGQTIRNTTDALAMTAIADGALGQAADIVTSIRTLAVAAGSPAQNAASRQALQAQAQGYLASLQDLARSTTYNGQSLLNGTFTGRTLQLGPEQTVNLSLPNLAPEALGDGETTLAAISLTEPEAAQAAVATADAALATVTSARTQVGASQNQLTATLSSLGTTLVNTEAARSTVADVDVAEESMNLARMRVLERANLFAAAQARGVNRERVLSLLQG